MLHVNLPDGTHTEITADLGTHVVEGRSGIKFNVIVSGRKLDREYLVERT